MQYNNIKKYLLAQEAAIVKTENMPKILNSECFNMTITYLH